VKILIDFALIGTFVSLLGVGVLWTNMPLAHPPRDHTLLKGLR
jgi:hypothetical protein